MPTLISPNMNLPVPTVGTEPGPDYAIDVNACLTLIDQHNHTPGYGAPIPAQALNIDADLSFNGHNATSVRSVRFQNQPSVFLGASDVGIVYEVLGNLYYRDAAGNNIQITNLGAIVGAPGNIAGLVPPASATYVPLNQTFVWQSNVATPAHMDFASAILRNLTPSSFGLTLSPPLLSSNYTITLPYLPVTPKVLSINSSGDMATGVASTVDANDLATDSVTTPKIQALAVTTAKIDNLAVTNAKLDNLSVTNGKLGNSSVTTDKLAPLNFTSANQTTNPFNVPIGPAATIPGVIQTITLTTARRVFVGLVAQNGSSGNGSYLGVQDGGGLVEAEIRIRRNGTVISNSTMVARTAGGILYSQMPPGNIWTVDNPGVGSWTYDIEVEVITSSGSGVVVTNFLTIDVYEM